MKAKKAEKPPRTANNDMPADNIDLSKENKNFEERKKLKGLQMDLS